MLEALTILLAGFAAAAQRDCDERLQDALGQDDEQVSSGLLTVLLRLVFLLHAEDRGLMPMVHAGDAKHLGAHALFEQLQAEHAASPETMERRFGAYPRLVALFRAVLFDSQQYPFLEGSPPQPGGSGVPSVSDDTIHRVLEKLLMPGGQRTSYRALEVEQLGRVYEALMGFVVRQVASPSVCLRGAKLWVGAREVLDLEAGQRAAWLEERGLSKASARKIASALGSTTTQSEVLAVLQRFALARTPTAQPGTFVIQPGQHRRRTGSHYTPRSLSEPIVRRTLEPLIAAMGPQPGSAALLRLKVCDPAMGSGAFLLAACRFLGDQVAAAWTRERGPGPPAAGPDEAVSQARRLVAQRCLYGVDKDPLAVNLAKLSLWLETLASDEPFTFVDHALKCGDSLVGLSAAQIERFEWTPDPCGETTSGGRPLTPCAGVIEDALLQACVARRKLHELAEVTAGPVAIVGVKARLQDDAQRVIERARVIGDVLLGAFFAKDHAKARLVEAGVRREAVHRWLMPGGAAAVPVELTRWVQQVRASQRPFHWELEFPEVFWDEREEPTNGDRVNPGARMDAVIGNPPFMGKNAILAACGPLALEWLQTVHPGAHGNADYSAHFFRRAHWLIGAHGTLGLIATNTIAQGDTRATGLQYLVQQGHVIFDANPSMKWPGEANVSVSVVHTAKGMQLAGMQLAGQRVAVVNSRLLPLPERADPVALRENAHRSFQGSIILGLGFVLTPPQRDALVRANPRNAERLFRYLGGEALNTSPTQASDRYVISFGPMSLVEAETWPELLAIVRRTVKPARDRLRDNTDGRRRRQYWWQFGRWTPALYAALEPLQRCLVNSLHSKHLCLAFAPTDGIFSHALNVFALDGDAHFAVLQSRVHEHWARLLGSSMRNDLRYTASNGFETFAFPRDLAPLAAIGARLDTARAAYMRATDQGLTKTYNALKSATVDDPRIVELRELHRELDREVLAAYGWSDVHVPHFQEPTTGAERTASQAFEDEVIDRLFALNAERAAQEQRGGQGTASDRGPKPEP